MHTILHNVEKVNQRKWAEFVYHHPRGNIFQTPEMYEIYLNYPKYDPIVLFVIDQNKSIQAVLVAVIQKETAGFFGRFSARSIIWGGPLVDDNNPKIIDMILKDYQQLVKKKAVYSQFRNLWDWGEARDIFTQNGFAYEDHLDILFDLNQTNDELWRQVHKERRKNIRRAEKKGVTFREIKEKSQITKAYELLFDTYQRIKLPLVNESFFLEAWRVLNPPRMIKFFGAFYQNKLISVRVVLCYKERVYDWYTGSFFQYRNKYPNDFLPWEIIKWSKQKGYSVFDFGGAGKPGIAYGVRDYKKKFGGKVLNNGRIIIIHHNMTYKVAELLYKIYRRVK